jgi:hypothetical protein
LLGTAISQRKPLRSTPVWVALKMSGEGGLEDGEIEEGEIVNEINPFQVPQLFIVPSHLSRCILIALSLFPVGATGMSAPVIRRSATTVPATEADKGAESDFGRIYEHTFVSDACLTTVLKENSDRNCKERKHNPFRDTDAVLKLIGGLILSIK